MSRIRVDFPLPLGPMMPNISPASTVKLMSSTARKRFFRFLIRLIMPPSSPSTMKVLVTPRHCSALCIMVYLIMKKLKFRMN